MQTPSDDEKRFQVPLPRLKDGPHRNALKQSLLAAHKETVMNETTSPASAQPKEAPKMAPKKKRLYFGLVAGTAIVAAVAMIGIGWQQPFAAKPQSSREVELVKRTDLALRGPMPVPRKSQEAVEGKPIFTESSVYQPLLPDMDWSVPPGAVSKLEPKAVQQLEATQRLFAAKAISEREYRDRLREITGGDAYAQRVENPFHKPSQTPVSTFSVDVDTASYANVRRFLMQERQLPPKDAVRIEEMVNYFDYDDPRPQDGKPVAIKTEVGPCPWNAAHRIVRIGLRAKLVAPEESPPRNLVFLVDTSGSMGSADRLPLLKKGLQLLVGTLRPQDRVAIVAYAGSAGLVLASTSGADRPEILRAIERLQSGGSTNGGEGIALAYKVAQENFIKDGVNRVILGTDGDFNVGVTSQGDLVRLIEEKRKSGILLSILGFGHGNLKDTTMEKLAHHGNGHYAYIDTLDEAHRIFVEQGAALEVVAYDVKVQVEFNPARVAAYRLVGYENRLMRREDFNDDTKDAGDMGSGHTVTALYEIVPAEAEAEQPGGDPLRYQQKPAARNPNLTDAAQSNELMLVKVRYKDPGADVSKLLTQPVADVRRPLAETSDDFRFATAVAEFAMALRDSPHKGTANLGNVLAQSRGSLGLDVQGARAGFTRMVEAAQRLKE